MNNINNANDNINNKIADLLFPNIKLTPEDIEKQYPPRDLPDGACDENRAQSYGIFAFGQFMGSFD